MYITSICSTKTKTTFRRDIFLLNKVLRTRLLCDEEAKIHILSIETHCNTEKTQAITVKLQSGL